MAPSSKFKFGISTLLIVRFKLISKRSAKHTLLLTETLIPESSTPLMSQSNLSELLYVIVKAAKVVIDETQCGEQFEAKELSTSYTSKAILGCIVGIGMFFYNSK